MQWILRLSRRLLVLVPVLFSPPLLAQPAFVDLVDFPSGEANWDRFHDLEAHLAQRFDVVCADTLCEGPYSNLRALQLRCSVRAANARVQACTWIFIASDLQVDPGTGSVLVDNRRWACALPLGTGVPVEAFHTALAGPEPLTVTLPGARQSVGEAVGACLQRPARAAPGARPSARYVDARDYPRAGQGQWRFRQTEQALVRGFDQICGDTFCEGEYYNLQAMRLRCAVRAASGRVQECRWTFAGSNAAVDPDSGRIEVDGRDWACLLPVAPDTPLPLLLDTLQGDAALDATLPGTTLSVYQGLTDCL